MYPPGGAHPKVALKVTGTGTSDNVEVRFTQGYKLANGRYEVGQEINRGGTAVVYEGYDSTLRMKVALKVRRRVTHPSFPPSRAQLCEEKKTDPPPDPSHR